METRIMKTTYFYSQKQWESMERLNLSEYKQYAPNGKQFTEMQSRAKPHRSNWGDAIVVQVVENLTSMHKQSNAQHISYKK